MKPGLHQLNYNGCLILAELDNSTWFSYPENIALQEDTRLLCQVGKQKGADFTIGPKLYGYLRQEKFNFVNATICQPALTGKYRHYLNLKSQAWADTYLEFNLTSQSDLENMAKQLNALTDNLDYLLAGAKMYLVSGKI